MKAGHSKKDASKKSASKAKPFKSAKAKPATKKPEAKTPKKKGKGKDGDEFEEFEEVDGEIEFPIEESFEDDFDGLEEDDDF